MYPPSMRTIYMIKQITLYLHLTYLHSDCFSHIIKKYKNIIIVKPRGILMILLKPESVQR